MQVLVLVLVLVRVCVCVSPSSNVFRSPSLSETVPHCQSICAQQTSNSLELHALSICMQALIAVEFTVANQHVVQPPA